MAEKQLSKPTPESEPIQVQPTKIRPKLSLVRQLCILLAVVSCLVYINTLNNGYVLDDPLVVNDNQYVKQGLKGIPDLLTTPHLKGYAADITDTYRPLSLVMFAIEHEFFGESPVAGHFFSMLIFAGAVLMLFLFLHKLFDGQRISLAFITALLFAVHPIHVEAVANIKSRDELLCFFFAFLSLNIFINYAREGKLLQLLLGTGCMFLAIISKETAFTFVGVVPLAFFFYQNENRKRSILITACMLTVAATFIIIRTIIINKYRADGMLTITVIDNALVGAPSMATHVATAILILGHYLKLLIIPYPLICDYSYNTIPYVGFGNIWVLVSLAAYLLLIAIGTFRLFKYKKDPWAFGILLFLFTISLFTNIPFVFGATQADRLIFFASAGTCLLMALAIEKWLLRSEAITALKSWKGIVLFAICITYAALSVSRNMDWADDYTLYKTDIEKAPDNTRLNAFLGTELQKKYEDEADPEKKQQIHSECIMYLRRSIEIYPENPSAQAALGTAYIIDAKYDSSVIHFKRALELDPKKMDAIANLGTLYSLQKMYPEAIPYYTRTVQLEPGDIAAWYNLAIADMHVRKYDSAVYAFNKTIELDPSYNNHAAFANSAVIYKLMGKMDSATRYEAITKHYFPRFSLDSTAVK